MQSLRMVMGELHGTGRQERDVPIWACVNVQGGPENPHPQVTKYMEFVASRITHEFLVSTSNDENTIE